MKKAIGYVRVSTTQQDLTRQIVLIKEWCALNGYTLVKVLEDKLSGTIAERKGYLELLSTTKDDTDIIVVSELSRLSRQDDIMETLTAINNLLKANIDIAFLDNNTVYKGGNSLDLMSILKIAIEASNAATERKKIIGRMLSGRQTKFAAFKGMCIGRTPFGYERQSNPDYIRNVTPRTFLVRNDNADVVKEIFNSVINGKKLKEIAANLRSRGILTQTKKDFDISAVDVLLHNPIYKGEWKFSGQIVKWDAIVTEEIWEKAQIALKENRVNDISFGINFNPLKGLLKCPCGKSMYIVHNYKYYQYRCSTKTEENKTCNNAGIDRDIAVECCWDSVKNIINTEDYIKQTNKEIKQLANKIEEIDLLINAVSESIEDIERQKEQLANNMLHLTNSQLLLTFQNNYDQLDNKSKAKQEEKKQLEKDKIQLVTTKEEIENKDAEKQLNNLTLEEKAVIFHRYFKKVVFYGEPLKHRGFLVITFKNGSEAVYLTIARKKNILVRLPFDFDVEQRKVKVETYPKREKNDFTFRTPIFRYYDCWQIETEFPDIMDEWQINKERPEFE